jgi:carbonic anhydrase/acetyltransferase-like protein (isoleucine patch superfamily)
MLRISISALALMSLFVPPSNAVAQHQTQAPAKPAIVAARGHASKDTTPAPKTAVAHRGVDDRTSSCEALVPMTSGRPIAPETAGPGHASFVDPTVRVESSERVLVGCRSYIGPFASIDASLGPIAIGHESNLQDNVVVTGTLVVIGDRVIIAHGATIMGPSSIGVSQGKPAFVGFNAYVDGAMIEADAMVGVLARVGPGVIIHAGTKVLPGKFVRTQAEADDSSLGKVTSVTDADRAFMQGVLHVNTTLAASYTELFHTSPGQLTGIGRDPGQSDFNATPDLPHLAGKAETHPQFRNRIIGHVEMDSSFEHLGTVLGKQVAIRADEGEHFTFGHVGRIQDRVTWSCATGPSCSVRRSAGEA